MKRAAVKEEDANAGPRDEDPEASEDPAGAPDDGGGDDDGGEAAGDGATPEERRRVRAGRGETGWEARAGRVNSFSNYQSALVPGDRGRGGRPPSTRPCAI